MGDAVVLVNGDGSAGFPAFASIFERLLMSLDWVGALYLPRPGVQSLAKGLRDI